MKVAISVLLFFVISNITFAQNPGYCLQFDGANDYVSVGPNFPTITDNFTMELWVYPTATRNSTNESNSGQAGTSGQRYAIFPRQYGTNHAGVGISVGNNGVSVFEHGPSYLPSLLVFNTTITGWTHIAVVYTNKQPRLYLNGVLVRTGLVSNKIVHPSSDLSLLNYGFFQGLIDEVRIWDYSLTENQIIQNMNIQLSGSETGLINYFKLDEGTGLIANDASGHGNNGTLVNGPQWIASNEQILLVLKTGYNEQTGLLIDPGQPDSSWTVIQDPISTTTEPRPGNVVQSKPEWSTLSGTRWVSALAGISPDGPNGIYIYDYQFQINTLNKNPKLIFDLLADDAAAVFLNGNFIDSMASYQTFKHIECSELSYFQNGTNTLRFVTYNIYLDGTGIDVNGLITSNSLLNIELSAPYTENSEFYNRTPKPLNKFLFNIRLTAPTLPSPPLNNISVIATLDGNPLDLQLNTSLCSLDVNNDEMIDQLPAVQKPDLNYIEFIASSNEYASNQMNKLLNVNITSINGEPVNISATDVVSMFFAKQGVNTFSLLRDAYSFPNPNKLTKWQYISTLATYGIKKGGWLTSLYEYSINGDGKCWGMSTTVGAYFVYPERKPLNGDVHDWNNYHLSVNNEINKAQISQMMFKDFLTTNFQDSYDLTKAALNIQRPAVIGMKTPVGVNGGGHATLACKLTTFNNRNISYIDFYDSNYPDQSRTAVANLNTNEFSYENYNSFKVSPQSIFTNYDDLNYYFSKYYKEKNITLLEVSKKVFSLGCPVYPLVTNSQGLRLGYLADGTLINEIIDGEVIRFPTGEFVGDSATIFLVPLNEEYELVMNSYDIGKFMFEHMEPIDSTILFTAASDSIQLTSQTICHFDETDSTHLYVDIDGNGTIDSTVNLYYSLLNLPLPGTVNSNINQGWNLISNPVTREENTDSVRQLYPNSEYPYVYKFGTATGYQQTHTMPNGMGFWGKFPSSGSNIIDGEMRDLDTLEVAAGWNIVGSLSVTIDTSTIISIPQNIRSSNWYGFSGGYTITNQIIPASAYWIKTNSAGKFIFSAGEQISKGNEGRENLLDQFNSITITDGTGNAQTLYFGVDAKKEIIQSFFEMPPSPPLGIFDARFRTISGDYILLTHSQEVINQIEFPIIIQSQNSSMSISWDIKSGEMYYQLTDGMNGKFFNSVIINGQGTLQLSNVKSISLKVLGDQYVPTKFCLEQNYPNPFNPSTKIKFSVPQEVQVNLSVFNILGERVTEMKNEMMKPGYYEVEFSASDLASGVYLYRIKAGDFLDTKKMILIK